MGKVLETQVIYIAPKNEERKDEMIVIRDYNEQEGYGVYIDYPGESVTSDTIVFGEGQLANHMSSAFYHATCRYYEYIGRKAESIEDLALLGNEWDEDLFLSWDKISFDLEGLNNILNFIEGYKDVYVNEKNQWFQTDDFQWVIIRGVTKFEVVNIFNGPEGKGYDVYHHVIDLQDYSEDEIFEYIKPFGYESRKDVEERYGGEYSANQIIAECISESNCHDGTSLGTEKKVKAYLQDSFGISFNVSVKEVG